MTFQLRPESVRMQIHKDTIIAVLMGGVSAERQVSLKSGESIVNCLQSAGYVVLPIIIDSDNPHIVSEQLTPKPDVVFNALHGTFGEDGQIQKILNDLDIVYTHSGYTASRIAMDKPQTIQRYKNAGIPVAVSVRMHPKDFKTNTLPFDMPYVIKPAHEGSSVGLHIIHSHQDIPDLSDWSYGDIMVEEFVDGIECTVSVLDGQAIGITELIPTGGVYDYDSKYTDGKTTHICNDVSFDTQVAKTLKAYAVQAHTLLGCRGVSRTDFRYNSKTGQVATLETNTHPGMTDLSLLPEQARAIGISFLDLILIMLQMAQKD